MAHKDYVAREVSIAYEGIFCFDDLYKNLKTWLQRRGYALQESGYKELKEELARHIKISIDAEKEANDYVKYGIELTIKLDNLKELKKKGENKLLHQGKVSIEFDAFMLKDFGDKWNKNPLLLFFREAYDKFVIGSQMEKMERELKEDVYKFTNEIKSFLKLLKL